MEAYYKNLHIFTYIIYDFLINFSKIVSGLNNDINL